VGLFGRNREERSLPPGAQLLGLAGGSPFTHSGETVTSDKALRLSAVWACVRLLSDTISSLPVHVYRGDDEVDTPPILREPAASYPMHDFVAATMTSLLLRGNAFALITARSGAGMLPSQVELVHPDRVGVTLNAETQQVEYRIGGVEFDASDVWHVRAYAQPGAVLGMSPVSFASESIGLGLAAQQYGAEYFSAGGVPVGTLDVADNPAQPWDDAANDSLTEVWRNWRRDGRRRGKVPILNGVKFTPVSINPDESQFLETQRFNVSQIARVFGVPPEMIAGEAGNSLTYANTAERSVDYLKYAISPWLVRLDHALGRLLPSTLSVKLNADALLRSTTKDRYEAHEIALRAGFLTIDEVRELEDLPPMPVAPAPSASAAPGNGTGTPAAMEVMPS
jgi:HK97 family phage portal protein